MIFKRAYGSFSCVSTVHVRRCQFIRLVVFFQSCFEFTATLIIKDEVFCCVTMRCQSGMKRFPPFAIDFACLFFNGSTKIALASKSYITIVYLFPLDNRYRKRPVWSEYVFSFGLKGYSIAALCHVFIAILSDGSKSSNSSVLLFFVDCKFALS